MDEVRVVLTLQRPPNLDNYFATSPSEVGNSYKPHRNYNCDENIWEWLDGWMLQARTTDGMASDGCYTLAAGEDRIRVYDSAFSNERTRSL